jgi:hypothetical protein
VAYRRSIRHLKKWGDNLVTSVTELDIASTAAEDLNRYYGLAKHQAWDVQALSWGKIAPVPEGRGSDAKRERRLAMWRSVVTQQLQADELASQVSLQLLMATADYEARLYYSTMAQDEARHYEAWLRLAKEAGGTSEPDPFLDQLGKLTMSAETLEEKVWLLQVTFEGLVIPRFHQIAGAAPGTILAEICNKLAIDDGIHHGAGVSYERILLGRATKKTRRDIARVSKMMWPLFIEHLMWRPRERAWATELMHDRDVEMLRGHRMEVLRLAADFNVDLELELSM